jgi:pyrroline-5-carboxylate reductase
MVLLAVKPQVMDSVVREVSGLVEGALVVSIAAGITTARLETLLPQSSRVVRVMPNTPALVGEGMALVSGGSDASERDVAAVAALFSAIGRAVIIDERYQDAGTAISGSGPAYFALVVDALARAGVAEGLPRATAQQLAVQTMLGTARMLQETDMHPEELIDGVASPGGTTIAAINALEAKGVRAAFAKAVSKAVRRARELGA